VEFRNAVFHRPLDARAFTFRPEDLEHRSR
jgi:hypothetical protein